jgi:hypothetical protein
MLRPLLIPGLLVLAGCPEMLLPAEYRDLASEVAVAPKIVTPGDTVYLLVLTTNRGSETVRAGVGCGPGLDFEVTLPDGSIRFPMREMAWICPIFDSNVLEPAETDSVRFAWATPQQRGQYRVRGGIGVRSGLGAASAARTFEVR